MQTLQPNTLECRWQRSKDQVQSLVIPVPAFPDRPEGRFPLWSVLGRQILTRLLIEHRLESELLIQFHPMHLGSNSLMSPNARHWMPSMGMGVWPYKDPPRLMTMEDTEDFDPSKPFPFFSHPLCRVTRESSKDHCWDTLSGWGVLAALLSPMDSSAFTRRAYDNLLPLISEPLFMVYQEYWPLLDASAPAANRSQVEKWLCGAKVYYRESIEDQKVILVSLLPINDVLAEFRPEPVDQADPALVRLSVAPSSAPGSFSTQTKLKAEESAEF